MLSENIVAFGSVSYTKYTQQTVHIKYQILGFGFVFEQLN